MTVAGRKSGPWASPPKLSQVTLDVPEEVDHDTHPPVGHHQYKVGLCLIFIVNIDSSTRSDSAFAIHPIVKDSASYVTKECALGSVLVCDVCQYIFKLCFVSCAG